MEIHCRCWKTWFSWNFQVSCCILPHLTVWHTVLVSRNVDRITCSTLYRSCIFMPRPSEKLRGHIGLGLSIHPSVSLSVRLSVTLWQLRNSRSAYARILKYVACIYVACKWKISGLVFFVFLHRSSFWSYAPFSTMYERPCEQNISRTAKARILIFGI